MQWASPYCFVKGGHIMFCMLLFYTWHVFGAAYPETSHEFYSDRSIRRMRRCMLPLISSGPACELDAYLTYVSDIACLSSYESAHKHLEEHREQLLFKSYRNQFDLEDPVVNGDEPPFFAAMKGARGVHCVEDVIEFGLQQLKRSNLSPIEVKLYGLFNDMICGLSASLAEDKQRKFWIAWIAQAANRKDKKVMFDLYRMVQHDLQGVRCRLNRYSELIKHALKT